MTCKRIATLVLASSLAIATGAAGATRRLDLPKDVTVHGKDLAQGAYRVELSPSGDTITFYQRKAPVAAFACETKPAPALAGTDMLIHSNVASGKPELTRILLGSERVEIKLLDVKPMDASAAPVALGGGGGSKRARS